MFVFQLIAVIDKQLMEVNEGLLLYFVPFLKKIKKLDSTKLMSFWYYSTIDTDFLYFIQFYRNNDNLTKSAMGVRMNIIHACVRSIVASFWMLMAILAFPLKSWSTVPIIQPIANVNIPAGEVLNQKILVTHPVRANVVVSATSTYLGNIISSLPINSQLIRNNQAFIMPLGDLNMDGVFNTADSLILNQFTVGLRSELRQGASLRFIQSLLADVNGDGVYNSADSLLMSQVLSDLRTYLPPSTENYHKFAFIWLPQHYDSIFQSGSYQVDIKATDKTTNEFATASFVVTATTTNAPPTPRLVINPTGNFPQNAHLKVQLVGGSNYYSIEKAITIERASSPSGPWATIGTNLMVDSLYPENETIQDDPFIVFTSLNYHNGNLAGGSTYYYRTKYLSNAGVYSKYSNIEYVKPAATSTITPLAKKWLIVLTYRNTDGGVPYPNSDVEALCNSSGETGIIQGLHAWFNRETKRLGQPKPFDSVSCLSTQVLLPNTMYPGTTPIKSEGTMITAPLKEKDVITYLETNYPEVKAADYVTIFHYLPVFQPFTSYLWTNKYDFSFNILDSGSNMLYPYMSFNWQVSTLSHEFMHRLGASDKYENTPTQACLIDPATGSQYSGYDIMCQRVPEGSYGFYTPYITQVWATDPTAIEAGWK